MLKIPENANLVLKAIFPLIVVIILFILLGNIGFKKIAEVQDQIYLARQDRAILEEKLDLLRNVAITGVEDSNTTTNSLPDSNSTLASVSQLKNLAATNGLVLSSAKAKSDTEEGGDINSVSITFNILGDRQGLMSFLTSIPSFAPITLLSKIKVVEINGSVSGEISVNTFWSPFPTKLPSTIDGLLELDASEKQTLTKVSSLTQPVFYNLPPSTDAGKEDPFVTD